jgi:predicted lipid-binding transport protein (Tim44 family)
MAAAPHGGWRIARRAVVEAWGAGGRGVRAVVTSAQLHRFLTEILDEAANSGASYRDLTVEVPTGQIRR